MPSDEQRGSMRWRGLRPAQARRTPAAAQACGTCPPTDRIPTAPEGAQRTRCTLAEQRRYLHCVFESVVLNEMRRVLRVHHLQELRLRLGGLERLRPLPALHVQLAQQPDVAALKPTRERGIKKQRSGLQMHSDHLHDRIDGDFGLAQLPESAYSHPEGVFALGRYLAHRSHLVRPPSAQGVDVARGTERTKSSTMPSATMLATARDHSPRATHRRAAAACNAR